MDEKLEETLRRIHYNYGVGDIVLVTWEFTDGGYVVAKPVSMPVRYHRYRLDDDYVTLHGQRRKIGYKSRYRRGK